jgi:hypothetical protein
MVRVPSIPMRKPDLIDMVEELIGPGVEGEGKWEDEAEARPLLEEMDRKAEDLAKRT